MKSFLRYDFCHVNYKASEDVYNKQLYFNGELEIHHIQYEEDSEQNEQPENGKGFFTGILAKVNLEDECLLAIDLDVLFLLISATIFV